uniref:G-protein coupled receptors family 1 profile domain-containing protein n=1 Tax=Acrobeloides nanus TaxID=290746 RepID=A0A914E4Z7_9BILA
MDTKYLIGLIASPILLLLPIFIIATIQAYDARYLAKLAICDLISDGMPQILNDLRWIRICATIIAILLYLMIAIKIYFILKRSKFKANNHEKNIIRAATTVGLLITNELVFIVLPDIYLYISPNTYLAGAFYILVMSKGIGNILLVLLMQRNLRREVLKFVKKILKLQFMKATIYVGT